MTIADTNPLAERVAAIERELDTERPRLVTEKTGRKGPVFGQFSRRSQRTKAL